MPGKLDSNLCCLIHPRVQCITCSIKYCEPCFIGYFVKTGLKTGDYILCPKCKARWTKDYLTEEGPVLRKNITILS